MARVVNCKMVTVSIITHGIFFARSFRSSNILDDSSGLGTILSLVVINVISNKTVPITASHVMVISIPRALSPSPT